MLDMLSFHQYVYLFFSKLRSSSHCKKLKESKTASRNFQTLTKLILHASTVFVTNSVGPAFVDAIILLVHLNEMQTYRHHHLL